MDRKSKNDNCTLYVPESVVDQLTYMALCNEAHSHSTVHQTGRFYCLILAVCSLHHRCRSLQSCRLYWRDCAGHLQEYQDHHSQWLGKRPCISMTTVNMVCWVTFQYNLCDGSSAIKSFTVRYRHIYNTQCQYIH